MPWSQSPSTYLPTTPSSVAFIKQFVHGNGLGIIVECYINMTNDDCTRRFMEEHLRMT